MEIKALDLMAGLRARGHEVRCVASGWNDGDFLQRLNAYGIPHETVLLGKLTKTLGPIPMWWMVNTLVRLPAALWRCRRHLNRFDPDVVLLFNRDAALLLTPLLRGRKCAFHVADVASATMWNHRLLAIINSRVRSWIAVSQYVGRALADLGIPSERITVVYNGLPWLGEVVAEPSPSEGRVPNIGVIGQVGAWKGHDDVIEALRLLKDAGAQFRCLIFGRGDPSYLARLRRRAADAGLEPFIEWRGTEKSRSSIYVSLDIVAMPSRFEEPFGLVAAEAGWVGLPVVVTRRGGLPEIVVDGETGFIIEAGRPDQLAERLQRLIESPELRRTMGEAGKRRVREKFTLEKMVIGHERVLTAVAASG
jgi:glycosyltransferase involved in cell wall biosynthesis